MFRYGRTAIWLLVAVGVSSAAGCAFEDGRGFARLSAELSAELLALSEDAGRLQPGGWFRTDGGFEVLVEALSVEIEEVGVYGAAVTSSSGDACHFDPSNPPDGCGSCHGGHCHCGDALVSYEELEAQICGTSAGATQPLLARLGADLIPLRIAPAQSPHQLTRCDPHCELPRGAVAAVRVAIGKVALAGTIRDGGGGDRLGGQQLPLSIAFDLEGATLAVAPEHALEIDRESPYLLHLGLELVLPDHLLDEIAFESLATSEAGIVVDAEQNAAALTTLTEHVLDAHLHLHVFRDGVEQEEHEGAAEGAH